MIHICLPLKTQFTSAPVEEAHAFLKRISGMEAEESPALGEGQDIRLSGSGLTGAALIAGERVVHLSSLEVFNGK
jgi:hypothetical protein